MAEYSRGSHTLYDIKYHFVWITKYRYPVLKGPIAHRLRELLRQGCESRDMTIIKGAIRPDHVHLLIRGMVKGHAPPFSGASDSIDKAGYSDPANESSLLINAILKQPFPPISLPKREYMENPKKIWEELGLPELKPASSWYGYSLGQWDEELEAEVDLAVKGEHYKTGDKLNALKVKVE